jgi:prepilin-type processing-associated H-X9-DG protein
MVMVFFVVLFIFLGPIPHFPREQPYRVQCIVFWNKAGGPEILTIENHEGKGCNVLYADGHVEFIKPDKISQLKWTIGKNNSDE